MNYVRRITIEHPELDTDIRLDAMTQHITWVDQLKPLYIMDEIELSMKLDKYIQFREPTVTRLEAIAILLYIDNVITENELSNYFAKSAPDWVLIKLVNSKLDNGKGFGKSDVVISWELFTNKFQSVIGDSCYQHGIPLDKLRNATTAYLKRAIMNNSMDEFMKYYEYITIEDLIALAEVSNDTRFLRVAITDISKIAGPNPREFINYIVDRFTDTDVKSAKLLLHATSEVTGWSVEEIYKDTVTNRISKHARYEDIKYQLNEIFF